VAVAGSLTWAGAVRGAWLVAPSVLDRSPAHRPARYVRATVVRIECPRKRFPQELLQALPLVFCAYRSRTFFVLAVFEVSEKL
jgi:hypothetical protein